jgi:hypothetical protein
MKILAKGVLLAFGVGAALAAGAVIAAPVTTMQFPTAGWGGFAPASVQCGMLKSANMNVTTDQIIPIAFPSSTYEITEISIANASTSLTTAVGGFYQTTSKGGTAIVANSQAYSTLTAAATNAAGSVLQATLAIPTAAFNLNAIYFALTTAQGAAATADIRVTCRPLYG